MTGDRTPSGCRWCGVPERGHFQRWSSPHGWHTWEPPTDAQTKQRMLARRADRITNRAAAYETEPSGDLRERLGDALRKAAHVCGEDCDGEGLHPILATSARDDRVVYIEGQPGDLAGAVLPVVEAALAEVETEIDDHIIKPERILHEQTIQRAEEAEAAVQRVREALVGLEVRAIQDSDDNTLIAIRNARAALDQPKETPACSCDGDPIECSHEAARGVAEATVQRIHAFAQSLHEPGAPLFWPEMGRRIQVELDDHGAGSGRCLSCDHPALLHQPDGCWFTVTTGTPDRNSVCPCSVPLAALDQPKETP